MAHESATVVLGNEISARLAEFSRKRVRDRRKAFGLKLGAAGLGAAITVMVGLKTSSEWDPTLKTIELVAGALIVILNAWDAFYDHKALWIKRTTTAARLKKLDRTFRIARAARPELDLETLERLHTTLEDILDDDLSSWLQTRSEHAPAATASADDAPAEPAGEPAA